MASQQVVPARPATIQPSLWLGCVATFVVFISIQRMSFEPEATLFLEAEIAVPVGAKIHGSGAAEETAVVRTETVWPSGV
ncbi:hypothetical protein DY000_02045828 [Brassica cretica]|uniref:Uncharacterized protein n=1 Tax=Brassica cretica TaxID=69181 RepID=A0ABQ7F615_BRACR|nr:hypothetical protein DY000_02045828 [Brassica cretica]